MLFRTEIDAQKSLWGILHKDKICLIGSCFTSNIGKKLQESGFATLLNPYGIIYNPYTIAECLISCTQNKHLSEQDLLQAGDFWVSYSHHGDFRAETKEAELALINNEIEKAYQWLSETKYLILTLGSAWIYSNNNNGRVMGNCHKLNPNLFSRKLMSVEETTNCLKESISSFLSLTKAENPKVILTVSPIRHWKDGAHGNQISKATLHLAIENIVQCFPQAVYFPSYEIMLDDLRDYRFYEDDLLHPNPMAVNYIWEKFSQSYFNQKTMELCAKFQKLNKMKAHRPFNPEGEEYKKHLQNIATLEEELKKEIEK